MVVLMGLDVVASHRNHLFYCFKYLLLFLMNFLIFVLNLFIFYVDFVCCMFFVFKQDTKTF